MATSVVFPRVQFFANNGRPLIGGRIHTYVAGSSTRAPTYKDAARAQPNANPIILDGRGEASVYLDIGVEYKFVVEDSKGALLLTQEPVYGAIWPDAASWPSDATLAYQYMLEAKAAASAIGPIKFYSTYAQALADIGNLQDGDLIEVSTDETHDDARTRYWVKDGALEFSVNLDQLRLDLTTPGGLEPAGGFTDYSVLQGYAGQATHVQILAPGIFGDFVRRGSRDADGGIVIKDALGRSWERNFAGAINLAWFGAKLTPGANSAAFDHPALLLALDYLDKQHGGSIKLTGGQVLWLPESVQISIPEACFIKGDHYPEINETDVPSMLRYTPRIALPETSTFIPAASAGISKAMIVKPNARFNVQSYERDAYYKGTAITIPDNSSGQYVTDVVAVGYEYAIASPSDAASIKRVHISNILHDCKHGVYLRNSFDLSESERVWGRPFCSFLATAESFDDHLRRDGANMTYDGVSAYSTMENCFDFGWKYGCRAIGNGNGAVTMTDCGSDHPGGRDDGSIGFDIRDASYEVNLNNPRSSGKAVLLHVNTQDPNGQITVVGGTLYESVVNAIVNERGQLFLSGTVLRNAGDGSTPVGSGIYAMNTSTSTHLSNCDINGFNIGVKTDSSGVKVYIDDQTSFDRNTTDINNPYYPGVLSANLLDVKGDPFYHVAGNADIINIANPARYVGKPLTLKFDMPLTVRATGGNIKMPADLVTAAGTVKTFYSDGVNFYG